MKGLLRRLFPGAPRMAPGASAEPSGSASFGPSSRLGRSHGVRVDGNTRTFWARGEASATTIVDVDADDEATSPQLRVDGHRVAEVTGRREQRPRGNPAFSETLFVELMRAGQFARAFDHITPECQRQWGSVDNFAKAQSGSRGAHRAIQGVTVRDVRYLDSWLDPESDMAYRNVAELTVEYMVESRVGSSAPATRLERTVHLVPVAGRWRSLCAPPLAARSERQAG